MVKFEIRTPSEEELNRMGITNWALWSKDVSKFDWAYDAIEKFYVLEGEAELSTDDETFHIKAGDLITCHTGVKCEWKVLKPFKKLYTFEAQ